MLGLPHALASIRPKVALLFSNAVRLDTDMTGRPKAQTTF